MLERFTLSYYCKNLNFICCACNTEIAHYFVMDNTISARLKKAEEQNRVEIVKWLVVCSKECFEYLKLKEC